MVRFLVLAVLAFLIFLVLRAAIAGFLAGLRGERGPARARAFRDDLVKDPVCATYVPRRTAVARTAGPVTYYFCSADCAAKFTFPS